jgi:hypothetical protein
MSLRADTINIGECLKSCIRSGITEGLLVDVVEEFVVGSVSGVRFWEGRNCNIKLVIDLATA